MDLVISRKHTVGARRDNCWACPTSKALCDVGFNIVTVRGNKNRTKMWVNAAETTVRVLVPKTLTKAINDWDNYKPFKLGTYRIPGLKRPKED